MAKPELIQTLSRLSKKIDSLLEENKSLHEKVKTLEKNNKELISSHLNDTLLLNKARKEIEFLSLSHRLAASPEALVEARNKISNLLRTIDTCIRMINED